MLAPTTGVHNYYTNTTTTTTTTVLRPFVRDYPGELVPEEIFTHPPYNQHKCCQYKSCHKDTDMQTQKSQHTSAIEKMHQEAAARHAPQLLLKASKQFHLTVIIACKKT